MSKLFCGFLSSCGGKDGRSEADKDAPGPRPVNAPTRRQSSVPTPAPAPAPQKQPTQAPPPSRQPTQAVQRTGSVETKAEASASGPVMYSFPLATSYLNPWKAAKYLDREDVLGEGNYRLEQKIDRFTLIAAHNLTPEQHKELLAIAGRKKLKGA